jgi:hypothetical protein
MVDQRLRCTILSNEGSEQSVSHTRTLPAGLGVWFWFPLVGRQSTECPRNRAARASFWVTKDAVPIPGAGGVVGIPGFAPRR